MIPFIGKEWSLRAVGPGKSTTVLNRTDQALWTRCYLSRSLEGEGGKRLPRGVAGAPLWAGAAHGLEESGWGEAEPGPTCAILGTRGLILGGGKPLAGKQGCDMI